MGEGEGEGEENRKAPLWDDPKRVHRGFCVAIGVVVGRVILVVGSVVVVIGSVVLVIGVVIPLEFCAWRAFCLKNLLFLKRHEMSGRTI